MKIRIQKKKKKTCGDVFVDVLFPESCDGYRCDNGQCVDLGTLCDGIDDCGDESDELSRCSKSDF